MLHTKTIKVASWGPKSISLSTRGLGCWSWRGSGGVNNEPGPFRHQNNNDLPDKIWCQSIFDWNRRPLEPIERLQNRSNELPTSRRTSCVRVNKGTKPLWVTSCDVWSLRPQAQTATGVLIGTENPGSNVAPQMLLAYFPRNYHVEVSLNLICSNKSHIFYTAIAKRNKVAWEFGLWLVYLGNLKGMFAATHPHCWKGVVWRIADTPYFPWRSGCA